MPSTALFTLDDRFDRDHASDFESRYGAYLRQNAASFLNLDDEPTDCPLEFAGAAWQIAQSPIMAPGYITTHPRILSAAPTWDDEHRLAIHIELATDLPAGLDRVLSWRGWQRNGPGGWHAPAEFDRPAAFTVLQLFIPMAVTGLPQPSYRVNGVVRGEFGNVVPDVEAAKDAVRVIADRLNAAVGPVVSLRTRAAVAS